MIEINGLKFNLCGESNAAIVEMVVGRNLYQLAAHLEGLQVIDIGAHVGSFSILAASRGAKVVAFEPTLQTFEILKENVLLNGQEKNITCHQLAIGMPGERKLYYDIGNGDGNRLEGSVTMYEQFKSQFPSQIVKTISLTEVINSYSSGHCDILKVDCEGIEYEMLDELLDDLHNKIDTILIELHEKTHARNFINKLRSFYYVDCLDAPGEKAEEWRLVKI